MPAVPLSVSHPGVQKIAETVAASLDSLIEAATEAIFAEVPAYRAIDDEQFRADVTAHVRAIFAAFLTGMTTGQQPRRADFAVTREQAARRVAQGVTLADFLQAFRIGQLTLWQGVLDAAGDDIVARDGALAIVAQIMQVIELGSTVAGEAYMAAQQHVLAEGDRVRRDLLEDLLARRAVPAGPRGGLLRAAGIGDATRLLVVAATLAADLPGDLSLRDVAPRVTGVAGGRGLAAVRQDEIVGITPLPKDGTGPAIKAIRRSCTALARRGVRLTVGISTEHAGLPEIPAAYTEARTARDGLGGAPGVLALPALTSFDYLVLRDDETARRLIRPQVRRFVTEDLAAGGTLVATLTEFAACDLNAKTAAERLHLHVNTAYYRLERIAERTGCDLRRLSDVLELMIAVRLLTRESS